MVAMAQQGGGSHYYGATAADLFFEPFAEEFVVLANLCARELNLSIGTHDGIEGDLLNAYPQV